jgi:hypothetical protein
MLLPFDVYRRYRGPKSWSISIVVGIVGAIVGWLIFAKGSASATTSSSTGGDPRVDHRRGDRAVPLELDRPGEAAADLTRQ